MMEVHLKSMPIKYLLNGKEIDLTGDNVKIKSNNFNVDENGNMSCSNANINGTVTSSNATITGGNINVKDNGTWDSGQIIATNSNNSDRQANFFSDGIWCKSDWNGDIEGTYYSTQFAVVNLSGEAINYGIIGDLGENNIKPNFRIFDTNSRTIIYPDKIVTPTVTQTSKESEKKNFEELQNGIDIIKDIDIYKYNLKSEEDTTKKHIGFVIGNNYNYSKEVTSNNNDGVDIYSFVAVCCKAIQEQQEQIESQNNLIQSLIERIEKLEAK